MDSSGYVCITFSLFRPFMASFDLKMFNYLPLCLTLDIRAEEDCGVHVPHCLLRQHRGGAVG